MASQVPGIGGTARRKAGDWPLDGRHGSTKIYAPAQPPQCQRSDTEEGGKVMSQPVSRLLHPFETARHPSVEPEVARAILTSPAPHASAAEARHQPRRPAEEKRTALQ